MVQFKNRYMVIEVLINASKDSAGNDPIIITEYNLLKAIKDSILLNFGECGFALSLGSLQVKYVNPSTKLCVIRTSRDDYQKVWSAMSMLKSIGKCPVTLNLLDLSGTMKACKNAALKCEEAKFEQYKLEAGDRFTPERSHQIRAYIQKIKSLEN